MDGMGGMMAGHGDGHGDHAPGSHLSYLCDGTHWTGMGYQRPSNWSTHLAPGVMVLMWAAHWTVGVYRAWFRSSKNAPYRARTTYKLPFLPEWVPLEGAIKVLFSCVGILTQLWWANGHWSANICPPGTARAGHFAITAVHNWQNAWTLFGFLLAGMVDLIAYWVVLPPNLPHCITASAFALQAFGLYQGQHQDMLDSMVYFIFALAVFSTAVAMTLELADPDAFWIGCLKAYTLWVQGVWYCVIARVLFGGYTQWDTLNPVPDMSPAMYVPVVFVMWMNFIALGMLLLYLACHWYYAAHLNEHLRAACGVERTLVLPDSAKGSGGLKQAELLPLIGGRL